VNEDARIEGILRAVDGWITARDVLAARWRSAGSPLALPGTTSPDVNAFAREMDNATRALLRTIPAMTPVQQEAYLELCGNLRKLWGMTTDRGV
jgi:hypothetical protein